MIYAFYLQASALHELRLHVKATRTADRGSHDRILQNRILIAQFILTPNISDCGKIRQTFSDSATGI